MKKILFFIILFFFSTYSFAQPINKVVFFGDSLTDNGNLYKVLKFPKSPYYQGRFSNGPTWADDLTQFFMEKWAATTENYSVGGATVVLRNPFAGFLPYDFDEEISHYLTKTFGQDRGQTLFIIWLGANDYLNGQKNVDHATTGVINVFYRDVSRLINHGGKHFLILNLPDLSKTPYGTSVTISQNLHDLAIAHNKKLQDALVELQHKNPNCQFKLIDMDYLLNDMIQNPAKYNQKYHTHLTNTTVACWLGGYTLQKEGNLKKETNGSLPPENLDYVLQSPGLHIAYDTEQAFASGLTPCEHPNEYLFWDHVHPTVVAHQILSQIIMEQL